MEPSKHEAEDQFAQAAAERAATVRRELGIDGLKVVLPPDFDDPAFSRRVLGLPD